MNRTSREIYDELLVTRCKRGDISAWDELVQRWNDRLLYYMRRLIDHEQDAVNALQETWLHTFRGMASLQANSRLAPWLYTIARRSAMNHYRGHFGRLEETSSESLEQIVDDCDDTQLRNESAELVHYGLKQLGRAEREVLTLYFLEDLSIDEIATVIDVPGGTVKSRLFKARRDLRAVLQREAERHET